MEPKCKKNVQLRFYAELNDFLSKEKKQVCISYEFWGSPTVKDAIEANGIPHIEVDMILVNSVSVDFNYHLKNGDQVSVYPVFEKLDISKVSKLSHSPLREIKFILDVHLGKLAKYLRMLGFDTFYRNNLEDREIVNISLEQKRIILTRDINLLKIKNITHGCFVRNTIPKKQIMEIIDRFDLKSKLNPLSRCIECNHSVVSVNKDEIADQLKPKTLKYYNDFFQCTHCKRIYWEGSHFDNMKEFVNDLMNKKKA